MELYSGTEHYKLYHGNMLDLLEVIEPNTIESVITDPPYELNFMGKGWDNSGIAFQKDTWEKCLKVLKPGGYLLAFGGSRTYHRIACAIEDAGFEIRDCIMWLYGSGFPKSMNIGLSIDKKNGVDNRTGRIVHHAQKGVAIAETRGAIGGGAFGEARDVEERKATNEWAGWGTALKPSYEPIIVARKPLEGSCTDNVIKYGVGGINIDECRVGTETISIHNAPAGTFAGGEYDRGSDTESYRDSVGRFPANTILTYGEEDKEEVCSGFPDTKSGKNGVRKSDSSNLNVYGKGIGIKAGMNNGEYGDEGSAARYFYCAKASRRDRDEGLDEMQTKSHAEINNRKEGSAGAERAYGGGTNPFLSVSSPRKNTHPTVKPTDLMQYLVRLVTPNGGTVLDPFNGSGSTGKAVMYENKDRNKNYKYIGIELTDEYLPIAKARIEYAINAVEEKQQEQQKQPTLFDLLS